MLGMQRVILLPGRGPVVRKLIVLAKTSQTRKNSITYKLIGLIALALGAMLPAQIATADYGPNSWVSFSNHQGSYGGATLSRSWESQLATGYPTLSAANIAPLKSAIARYKTIVANGGWQPVPMLKLRAGMRHAAIVTLRRRLMATGDLSERAGLSPRYDANVTRGLMAFQQRHGLKVTGTIDKSTLLALNVSADARLRQLQINLGRLRTLSASAAKKYVVVNIPAAQIEAVDNDTVVSRHAAVVGKIDRKTPLLKSKIHQINFNPYWHIPQSIVRKDLVPKARMYARRGKDILAEYRIDAYAGGKKLDPQRINWNSSSVYGYTYRQQPWVDNSMGFVKINFHNAHSVYLHDTPSKSLFNRNFRAHSSGCVRVQNVQQLVSWLLEANGGWDMSAIAQIKQSGARKDVNLKRRVPIYLVYVTAWATKDGRVNFRRDLYGRDRVGPTASAY